MTSDLKPELASEEKNNKKTYLEGHPHLISNQVRFYHHLIQ